MTEDESYGQAEKFTAEIDRLHILITKLMDAGHCCINSMTTVHALRAPTTGDWANLLASSTLMRDAITAAQNELAKNLGRRKETGT